MPLKQLLLLKPLCISFIGFAPRQVLVVLILMLSNSISSGLGILFIVPLLNVVGVQLGPADASGINQQLLSFAHNIGFSFTLLSTLLLYLSLIITVGLIAYLHSTLSSRLQSHFTHTLRQRLFKTVLHTRWQYLNQQRSSDFMRLITRQVHTVGATVQQLLTLSGQVILVAVYISLSLYLSPLLTIAALSCALCLLLALITLNRRIHASGQSSLSANKQIFSDMTEQLASLKMIKSFTAEAHYLQRLSHVSQTLEQQAVRINRFNALSRFVNLSGAAAIFTVILYIAISILSLPLANLVLILFIFARLMPQVSAIQGTIQRLIHLTPANIDLHETQQALLQHQEDSQAEQSPHLNKGLQLHNVSYCYPGKSTPIIKELSLNINAKQTVAIVGPSGAGKSTLVDMIAGLIKPSTGTISVDGIEITQSKQYHWRTRVAYVTQEIFLFNDTIRANLAWVSQTPVNEDALWHALSQAAAKDFVSALPQGLDTLIGDRGTKLSGGERQRLALARALLSAPEILILDEATSALDYDNEIKIRDALIALNGQLTIIIIAHDENTIAHAQQRICLADKLNKPEI